MRKNVMNIVIVCLLVLLCSSLYAWQTGLSGIKQEKFKDYPRHYVIQAGSAMLGPTAPTVKTIGTARALCFGTDAAAVFFHWDVGHDWNQASDYTVKLWWSADPGDPIQNGETVKWDISWYGASAGEAIDDGTVQSASLSYTGTTGELDKELYVTEVSAPYSGGNQPLRVDDIIFMELHRDASGDTYSGDACLCRAEVNFNAATLPYH
jgi:hypothetical protein